MTGFAIRAAADRAHEWSLLFADRVFGGSEPAPPAERWLLRYLGVVVLLAAVIVARRPDAVTNPQTAPVHTFHVGLWFNSPTEAQAAGCPSTVTPFNGEHHAGIQALATNQFGNLNGPLRLLKP